MVDSNLAEKHHKIERKKKISAWLCGNGGNEVTCWEMRFVNVYFFFEEHCQCLFVGQLVVDVLGNVRQGIRECRSSCERVMVIDCFFQPFSWY